MKYSPHLKIFDIHKEATKYVFKYCKNHKNISFLDVGGRGGQGKVVKGTRERFEINYANIELDAEAASPEAIKGDICHCPQISNESYDIVFSHNVFEHLKTPWTAAEECIRINKIGGLNVHIAPFSWHYHPVPVDCFRFTHAGLKILFENSGKMKELSTGYDIKRRRRDIRGGNAAIGGGLDLVPIDKLGGWRENWLVLYVGRRIK